MITLAQAKELRIGQEIFDVRYRNSDGLPATWRVNGQVKTWKTRPDEVRVPLKYGLCDHDYLTHWNLDCFALSPEEALGVDRYQVNVRRFKNFTRITVKDVLSSAKWVEKIDNDALDKLAYPLRIEVKEMDAGYCLDYGIGQIELS